MDLAAALVSALRRNLAGERPRVPEPGRLLWRVFIDLHGTRSSGMAANPISYQEVESYCRLHRLPLEPRHIRIIREMDDTWLEHVAAAREQRRDGVKVLPKRSTQPLTPALMDAMFG